MDRYAQRNVAPLRKKRKAAKRKSDLNYKKKGSIRNINGIVYMDFIYHGKRVRESSGLAWNEKNVLDERKKLDRIMMKIEDGAFRFKEHFPESRHVAYFTSLEQHAFGFKKTPAEVNVGEDLLAWQARRETAGVVEGRTTYGHSSYLTNYLIPFFGGMTYAELNKVVFERFIAWAKERKLKGEPITNTTINKIFTPLRMTCKDAIIENGWGGSYDPFFGFKKLPEEPSEEIFPFSLKEQKLIRAALPEFWRPYFDVAFRIGLRQSEEIGLKPGDINWEKGVIRVRRAITLDKHGKRTEGKTKNKHSVRTIKLKPFMLKALLAQKKIHKGTGGVYFFTMPDGTRVDPYRLRKDVWKPALEAAQVEPRAMKQTRHSFATNALAFNENPAWIAKVMGHKDTTMIIKVYMRFAEDLKGTPDGSGLGKAYGRLVGEDS